MNCRDFDKVLNDVGKYGALPESAQNHVLGCPACRRLLSAFAAQPVTEVVDPALLQRIQKSLQSSLAPVRPLRPATYFVTGFLTIFIGVALLGATILGFKGLHALSVIERAMIYGAIAASAILVAVAVSRGMVPGSKMISAAAVLTTGFIGMEVAILLLFPDYTHAHFISAGLVCLALGLTGATLAAFLAWLLVRCGFVLEGGAVGLQVGALGGLSGVAMLALFCPNITVPHVAVWHIAVLLLSAGGGALVGWSSALFRPRLQHRMPSDS